MNLVCNPYTNPAVQIGHARGITNFRRLILVLWRRDLKIFSVNHEADNFYLFSMQSKISHDFWVGRFHS